MYFTSKKYKVLKFKNYFKNQSFFIIFHCIKLNLTQWTLVEQKFKKLKLNYCKFLNKISEKELKKSVYLNYSSVINSFILCVSFSTNSKDISKEDLFNNLNKLESNLNCLFIKVSVKLNNKLYFPQQFNKLQNLNYEKIMFRFNTLQYKFLKTSYTIN